ncbi:MAG: sensor histidine kinase [Planctomycetota bacterium]|nr:sensor histidine kinase [Planctomycetota bacterium]
MADNDQSDSREQLVRLGHLASAVGHHIINAFSAVVSNAELLRIARQEPRERPSTFDSEALLEVIIRSSLDASQVARRLIDATREVTSLDYGGDERASEESSRALRIDELLREQLAIERGKGDGRIEWVDELAPLPTIVGDPCQLRLLFGRLFENAREAFVGGVGRVVVTSAIDDRGWIVIEVADNGAGMSADVIEHAVEPFFTTKPGHLGVGLSVANGIWRRHRGTFALRGEPGAGSAIRLCVDPRRSG